MGRKIKNRYEKLQLTLTCSEAALARKKRLSVNTNVPAAEAVWIS